MSASSKPDTKSDESALLAQVLSKHDAACPHCGYNLRGAETTACPECGGTVTLEALLKRKNPLSLTWALGFLSLALSLPVSLLMWQRLAIRRLFFYGEQRWLPQTHQYIQPDVALTNPWFVGSTLYWYLIPVGVLLMWLLRQRFERLPPAARWVIACSLFLATTLGHRRWMFWYYRLGLEGVSPWPMWYLH